jgi:hypothetical protein
MMMNETLNTALAQAYSAKYGDDKIPFACGGKAFPTSIETMEPDKIAAVLRYGKRMLNDSYNSIAKKNREEGKLAPNPDDFFADWYEDLGKATSKSRGPSLTDREKAERQVLALKLESICGLTRTKAEAKAKHPDEAWSEITRRIVITQVGKGKTSEEIAENLENWITAALPAVKSSFEQEILDRMPKSTEVKLDLSQILG